MKIYNEIIFQWNDNTQKYETIYEDSCDYTGELMLMQSGDTGAENTEYPEYGEQWHNENVEEYKLVLSEKISQLLLNKFSELEEKSGETFSELQKTFRNGILKNGRLDGETMVVYEADYDADNDKGNDLFSIIVNWANFVNPESLSIEISTVIDNDNLQTHPFQLELICSGKAPLNINNILNEQSLTDVKLRETVSQFLNLNKLKTTIDKSKLSDFIEMDFSELNPLTFTHILERYQKFKKDLPFFRYRTDDFFQEYNSSNLPLTYRLRRFFEQFELLKSDIPDGRFGYNAVTIHAQGVGYYQFINDNLGEGREPRTLKIINKDGSENLIYEDFGSQFSRGLRMTVFSKDSFEDGKWNGTIKADEVYDTYGGRTHFYPENSPNYGLLTADKLADFINSTEVANDDLIVLTSYDAIRFSNKLTNSLKLIGAFDPKILPPLNPPDDLSNFTQNVKLENNFNKPNTHLTSNLAAYTSAASVTVPNHVVLNNLGYITSPSNVERGPGKKDGEGSNGTNENVQWQSGQTPHIGNNIIKQTRTGFDTEYDIPVFTLKAGTTYTLALWLTSQDDISNFSPFHAKAYSVDALDLNDPIHTVIFPGSETLGEVTHTKTIERPGEVTTTVYNWERREIQITTPENNTGIVGQGTNSVTYRDGSLNWFVGYQADDELNVHDGKVIYYAGFEVYPTHIGNMQPEYNGYYGNGTLSVKLGDEYIRRNGHYNAPRYDGESDLDVDLIAIGNNLKWLYTPQKGWTILFSGSSNEALVDENSIGSMIYGIIPPINEDIQGLDPATFYPVLKPIGPSPSMDYLAVDYLTVMMDVYIIEYDMELPGNRILINKEYDYEMGICNNGELNTFTASIPNWPHWATCEPGELLWAIKLEAGGTWMWTGTNYIIPLESWTNVAMTYDGTSGVKLYANGELVSHATHASLKHFAAPEDSDFIEGIDYTQNLVIQKSGSPFMVGGRPHSTNNYVISSNLQNVSIDRLYVLNKALSTHEIYSIANSTMGSQLGTNDQRTPYVLIGSKQFERGDGVEVIEEAHPDAPIAEASKFWPPDAEYLDWRESTAAYMISELQQHSNEDVPAFTTNDIIQLKTEVESLSQKVTDLHLQVNQKDVEISTLESTLGSMNAAREWHGDCVSVNGGFTCEDTITHGDVIYATCTDGEQLALYCNPENAVGICIGQPLYPFGGPISGEQACEGS